MIWFVMIVAWLLSCAAFAFFFFRGLRRAMERPSRIYMPGGPVLILHPGLDESIAPHWEWLHEDGPLRERLSSGSIRIERCMGAQLPPAWCRARYLMVSPSNPRGDEGRDWIEVHPDDVRVNMCLGLAVVPATLRRPYRMLVERMGVRV